MQLIGSAVLIGGLSILWPVMPLDGTGEAVASISTSSAAIDVPAGWTGSGCRACHTVESGFSHPVDVEPAMEIPPQFPLVDGRLACVTCHDGDSASAHARARREGSELLRGTARGTAFCGQCHDPATASRADLHALATGRAHLKPPRLPGQPFAGRDAECRTLDALGAGRCSSCHDGALASSGDHRFAALAGGGWPRRPAVGASHPVGMPFPVRNGYHSTDDLDARIHLPGGRVECTSCHSPYAGHDHLLVAPLQRSALCLSCHDP